MRCSCGEAMRKSRYFWLAYSAAVGLAVFWGARLLSPRFLEHPHRINLASYEKIQGGMTLSDMESLLGVPPGDYSTQSYFRFGGIGLSDAWQIEWIGNEGRIGVQLDKQNRVTRHAWEQHFNTEETLFDKVRGWFGFQSKAKIPSGTVFWGPIPGKVNWDASP